MSYVISCESTADLSKEHFESRQIRYVCFHYHMDGVDYPDDLGVTMPISEFYERLQNGSDSTTSQVNTSEYLDYFEQFLAAGQDVLHVSLSSGISGSYSAACNAALVARSRYPERKLFVVDSLAASSGFGLFMDLLADERDAGLTIEELRDFAEANKLRVHHWFFSTDLTFYVKGGRVSKAAALFGGVLNICPLLNVSSDGHLIARERVRGKKNVIRRTVKKMTEFADNALSYDGKCYISNSACLGDAEEVAAEVEAAFPALKGKVEIYSIGTVIGSHTGPGTVALFFLGKPREN
ncbi:MAG: DegV family protein [Lachnospiraceae bacterium]|nr:DegV family protein [Lachnospiraceae bacterium]